MAHAQKPDSVFQRNGRVHLYQRGCQFSRVLAFLECGSAENDCSNTGWTVPSQAEDCWLPTPFASFPFTSPVHRRVPPDSVSTLPSLLVIGPEFLLRKLPCLSRLQRKTHVKCDLCRSRVMFDVCPNDTTVQFTSV